MPSPPLAATHLADCTATDLLNLYRSRQASPLEATRAVLDRIDALNPHLNAFCLVAHESALQSARESEARWNRGAPTGELDGVPVSIKDLILTRGWPTLRGSRTVDADQPWDTDAPATARLRRHVTTAAASGCVQTTHCRGSITRIAAGRSMTTSWVSGSIGRSCHAAGSSLAPASSATSSKASSCSLRTMRPVKPRLAIDSHRLRIRQAEPNRPPSSRYSSGTAVITP